MIIEESAKFRHKPSVIAKKYLGIFEHESLASGKIFVMSDFNIQEASNLNLLEDVCLLLSLDHTEPSARPDAIILCGPFMKDMLVNSREDQATVDEAYSTFTQLLLKY